MKQKIKPTSFTKYFCFYEQDVDIINSQNEQLYSPTFEGYGHIEPLVTSSARFLDGLDFGHLMTEELFVITTRFKPAILNCNIAWQLDRKFYLKRKINIAEQNRYLQIIAQESNN